MADIEARFFNRELSWLRFNARVLEEAVDERNPVLERARFLAIVSSNLDEFSMVRLARLYCQREESGAGHDPAGLSRQEHLDAVRTALAAQIADQYACWNEQVEPALQEAGVRIVRSAEWSEADRDSFAVYYQEQLEPQLTPLAVDIGHPFPLVGNCALYVALSLRVSGDADAEHKRALVAVPGGGRLIPLVGQSGRYAVLEDLVAFFLDQLFPGFDILDSVFMRVTRDGGIEIDEDQAIDLLSEIEQELRNRAFGEPVRLELAATGAQLSADLAAWLQEQLELEDANVIRVAGPLDLKMLFELAAREARAELQFEPFDPIACPRDWSNPFAAMRSGDLLLHHPYQSFSPVVELVQVAAADTAVRAIKMTLYRVSGDSPIVKALIAAAIAGKQVTVLVELKARFDEEANIRWARRLEQAGAHVVYGIAGYKVHCKLLLVIRQEEAGIRRYCQLGTGNYNDKTARLYTDFSYLTANEAVGRDVAALFNMITGFSRPHHWERMAAAPYTMRERFITWIRREAAHARAGRPAHIKAKFNSLVDVHICEELYAASQAGVTIALTVRGICILRPGVPGLSERITVRSIIGRFLEHSRYYHFHNNGDPVSVISSADWMTRNLDRRVEHLVEIDHDAICERLELLFDITQVDNRQARVLEADGSYTRLMPASEAAACATQQQHHEEARSHKPVGRQRPQGRQGLRPMRRLR